jgi:hypothetical protein
MLMGSSQKCTCIIFRVTPPDFDMHNSVAASTIIPQPEVGVAKKNDKWKKKMWKVLKNIIYFVMLNCDEHGLLLCFMLKCDEQVCWLCYVMLNCDEHGLLLCYVKV